VQGARWTHMASYRHHLHHTVSDTLYHQLLVTRFTSSATHGKQPACSQGRSTTVCSDTTLSDSFPSQWSGEGVLAYAVSQHPLFANA
jgi:hypothetical protein